MLIDAIGAFLIVGANMIFWLLAIYRKPVSEMGRSFFWWSFFITLWAFGYGITLAGFFDYAITLNWNRFCQAMAVMIGPFYFRLGCVLVGRYHRYQKLFYFYAAIAVVNAVALGTTPYYVKGLWSFGPYPFQPLGGPLYSLFVLIFLGPTLHAFWVVIRSYSTIQSNQKKQTQLFLGATTLSYIGGFSLFMQAYRIPLFSTGVYLILAYVVMMGYLVYRYNFFDVNTLVSVIQQERLATMGLLSASIHHEIKNPLYIIKSQMEVAIDGYDRDRSSVSLEVLEKVHHQAERIFQVLQTMQHFINKKTQAKASLVKITQVLCTVRDLVGYELDKKQMKLNINIQSNMAEVYCSQVDLESILINLTMNAIQASQKDSAMSITAKKEKGQILIEVQDSGSGISEDQQSQIFDPFYTTKADGTGLGLYIVKQLVEKNGGAIEVISEPESGATFSIRF